MKRIDKDLDDPEALEKMPPSEGKILSRGLAARKARHRELAKARGWDKRKSVGIEEELIEQFKELSGEKHHSDLINEALRDWLAVQGVKELLREELGGLVGEAVETIKEAGQAIRDAT